MNAMAGTPMTSRRRQSYWAFWFEPVLPSDLGFCRFLYFGIVWTILLSYSFNQYSHIPLAFYDPIWFFDALSLPIPNAAAIAWLQPALKTSMFLVFIGLFTRTSLVISLVLSLYLFGMLQNWGKIGHGHTVPIFVMFILAFSRCGDAWSVDAMIRAIRHPDQAQPYRSGEYRWPVRMIWMLFAIVFCAAGIAKLRHGWTWITSDTMKNLLIQHSQTHRPSLDAGRWLAQYDLLCHILAAATIAVELLFPLALILRPIRPVFVAAALMMQVGIATLMGVMFPFWIAAYLFFVPWDAVGRVLQRALANMPKHTFLYDGPCGLCIRTVGVFRRLDVFDRIEFIDVFNNWPGVSHRWPELDQDACLRDIHIIDPQGTVRAGFDGYRRAAWAMPFFWPVAPLLYLPGVPQLGRKVYRHVADQRMRAGCAVPIKARA